MQTLLFDTVKESSLRIRWFMCRKEFCCNRKTELIRRFQSSGIYNYYFSKNRNKRKPKAQNNKDDETSTVWKNVSWKLVFLPILRLALMCECEGWCVKV